MTTTTTPGTGPMRVVVCVVCGPGLERARGTNISADFAHPIPQLRRGIFLRWLGMPHTLCCWCMYLPPSRGSQPSHHHYLSCCGTPPLLPFYPPS